MLLVWVFFEVALYDFFFSWARSTNKQLANRKSTWYFGGGSTKSKAALFPFVFDRRFCLFQTAKAAVGMILSHFYPLQTNKTEGNIRPKNVQTPEWMHMIYIPLRVL